MRDTKKTEAAPKPVVVRIDFAAARKKKEYDAAVKKILERAGKLDW
jgi:hypothetical protein